MKPRAVSHDFHIDFLSACGHKWMLGTHKEEVPKEEMERRGKAWLEDMKQRTN